MDSLPESISFRSDGFVSSVDANLLIAFILYLLGPAEDGTLELKAQSVATHSCRDLVTAFRVMDVKMPVEPLLCAVRYKLKT